ncbi:MAG: lipocalin family protein [Gemmatimonadota bacterium]|nr:lipocalin family protein [Gemmatimonadota bacterium]
MDVPNRLRFRIERMFANGIESRSMAPRSLRPGRTYALREERLVSHAGRNRPARISAFLGIAKAVCAVALFSCLAGCGGDPLSPEEAILGTWKLTHARNEPVTVNYMLVFEENGVYTFINTIFDGSQITSTGSWRIEQGALFLDALDFGYSIDNDELTLYATDGTVFVYARQ